MNIYMIGTFPPFRGGISHFNTILYRTLSKDYPVKAINFTTQYPDYFFPGKTQMEESSLVSDVSSLRLLSSINPYSWIKTGKKIAEQKADLVIFKYWMPFFAPAFGTVVRILKHKLNTKVLIICDNIIPHETHWYDKILTRYFFNVVDYFVVMSKSVGNDLLKLYPDATYVYSPHPIYDIFGNLKNTDKARQELGITAQNVILFFGYIRQYKGLDLLIQAAEKLKNRLDDFMVLVVGECYENEDHYKNLVKKLDVADVVDLRMQFIPDRDVAAYFSATDIVALPYRSATQSGIVNIAYHFNKPVIVTNVGGLSEIVQDKKVGYVVEAENPDSICDSIVDFFKNNRSEFMVNNVIEHKKIFSWDSFKKTLESFF